MIRLPDSSISRRCLPGSPLASSEQPAKGYGTLGDVVSVPLQPGQMVIFDVFTAHGASPNLSNQRRAGFAIRYMPGTSIFDRNMKVGSGQDDVQTDLGQRALFLVRGEDKTGKNDFTIGHDGMTVEVM